MKTPALPFFVTAAALSLCVLSPTRADDLTWDPSADGSGSGGGGTWDTSSSNWYDGSADTTWTNGSTAAFNSAASAYTVALDPGITVGGITTDGSGGGTINIGTSSETDTLTFQSGATINAGRAITFNGPLSGGDLTITSSKGRAVTFKHANAITGTVSLEGQVRLATTVTDALSSSASIQFNNVSASTSAALLLGADLTVAGLNSVGDNTSLTVIRSNVSSGTVTLTINTDGAASPADSTYAGKINDNGAGQTALTKAGSHTLTLTGVSAYTGDTNVTGGTLVVDGSIVSATIVSGSGTLAGSGTTGSVTIQSGGALAVGDNGIGTLTVDGDLTLGGTTTMEISKSGTTFTSDLASVTGTLFLGGNLNVTASGDALVAGDTFTLFDAGTISGSFVNFSSLPTLAAGLGWDTAHLAIDGTLSVVAIPEPATLAALLGGVCLLVIGVRRLRRLRA